MNEPKYLKCSCQRCGGHIEFPADAAGAAVNCPHCGQKTELSAPPTPAAPETPEPRRTAAGWIIAAIVLLLAGSGGFVYWQKGKPEKPAVRSPIDPAAKTQTLNPTNAPAVSTNRLAVGSITLERTKSSSVVYAVGEIKNESDRQRFGVKVELDLLDGNGLKIGTASDYLAILEPRKEWRFRALVLESKAVSARIAAIREDQ